MKILKSRLKNQNAYNEIYSSNSEQNPGYIVKKIIGDGIYVKKLQQDMTAQYSTPFVGRIIFTQGDSAIKGMFVPALQMTVFRVLLLGLFLYCLISDFITYGRITWNIGEFLLLAVLLIAEVAGVRKKHEIKCSVIRFMESTFQAELISPRKKYQETELNQQDQYEVWHYGLFLVVYLIMILICIPPFSFGVYISILAGVWYGVVIFMGLALATVGAGIIHTEWLWRIRFNKEGITLKILWREKITIKWNEIQEIGLAPVSTNSGCATSIQTWIFISRDHLVYSDFSEVMKKNERNPKIIWLIYNKKNYEILRQFYKGHILNFDSLKELTQ